MARMSFKRHRFPAEVIHKHSTLRARCPHLSQSDHHRQSLLELPREPLV